MLWPIAVYRSSNRWTIPTCDSHSEPDPVTATGLFRRSPFCGAVIVLYSLVTPTTIQIPLEVLPSRRLSVTLIGGKGPQHPTRTEGVTCTTASTSCTPPPLTSTTALSAGVRSKALTKSFVVESASSFQGWCPWLTRS